MSLISRTSSDGGASWSSTNRIAKVAFHSPAGGIRADITLPSAEMDGAGTAYVVWSDCHFETGCNASDLVLSTSGDGKNWSKLTRLPIDPIGSGVDHFIPGLAVDRSSSGSSAHLLVTYYYYPVANCTVSTCQLDVGYSASADGGASWSSNIQLSGPMSLSWLPNTTQKPSQMSLDSGGQDLLEEKKSSLEHMNLALAFQRPENYAEGKNHREEMPLARERVSMPKHRDERHEPTHE